MIPAKQLQVNELNRSSQFHRPDFFVDPWFRAISIETRTEFGSPLTLSIVLPDRIIFCNPAPGNSACPEARLHRADGSNFGAANRGGWLGLIPDDSPVNRRIPRIKVIAFQVTLGAASARPLIPPLCKSQLCLRSSYCQEGESCTHAGCGQHRAHGRSHGHAVGF
jgi:hypothetical protein